MLTCYSSFFDYMEIYPGDKRTHFQKIQAQSKLPYEEMLFFDDEPRNRNVEELGVKMHLVRDGVSWSSFDAGIKAWRSRKGHK